MKIAIVHPKMNSVGGAERIVAVLYGQLRARGHDVHVFTRYFNPSVWPGGTFDSRKVHAIGNAMLRPFKYLSSLYCAMVLRRLLPGFDIVNPHNYPATFWVSLSAKHLDPRPPLVWYCQEPYRRLYRNITDRSLFAFSNQPEGSPEYIRYFQRRRDTLLRREFFLHNPLERERKRDRTAIEAMDLILANSLFTLNNLDTILSGFHRNMQVCYLGADLPPDVQDTDSEKAGFLLAMAPMSLHKNPITVVETARILVHRMNIDVKMKLIGRGQEHRTIRSLIQKYQLTENIEMIEWIDEQSLFSLMRRAICTLYIPIDEPFGLVPIESSAAGTPCVVSEHGGTRETVLHEITGFHANPFSPEDVAEKCRDLFLHPEKSRRMGRDARAFVKENFSRDRFVDTFEWHLIRTARKGGSMG